MASTATANIVEQTTEVTLETSQKHSEFTSPFEDKSASRGFDERLQALTARRAARINAASIQDTEVEALLKERAALLSKKFDGGMSAPEVRRLALIRWSLDRIHDARHGEALDTLEAAIARYERLGDDIRSLIAQLSLHAPRGVKK